MADPWSQLPRASALVYASILTTTASPIASARERDADAPALSPEPVVPDDKRKKAPTCGPACHDGHESELPDAYWQRNKKPPPDPTLGPLPTPDPEPEQVEALEPAREIAPTCGPSCHGTEVEPVPEPPPPVAEPSRTRGCTIDGEGDPSTLPIAFVLGVLGVGIGRRRDHHGPRG